MNIYFHVTNDFVLKTGDVVKPRIPKSAAIGENENIPRFCVSNSIEGCLTSVIWGLYELSKGDVFRILEIDLDSYSEDNIIHPNELVDNDLVCDAEVCGETWIINSDVKIISHRDVVVTDIITEQCGWEGFEGYDVISYVDFEDISNAKC